MTTHTNNEKFAKNKIASVVKHSLSGLSFTILLSSINGMLYAQETTPNSDLEVIEVAGIRSSLEAAQFIKRNANTVVEAITAEDIGQFSDDSIAGALQRIPGVQIESDDAGTDGDRVSIRGLGPEFVNSTINGRRLLSSGNEARSLRKMNFNAFPPSVLGGVEVAKGQTAARPESGLAGQINLQTIKPLDLKKLDKKTSFGQISVRGTQQDIINEAGYRISALGGWRNEENTLGGYVAVVSSDERTARDQVRINSDTKNLKTDTTGDGIADSTVSDVLAPASITMNPIREEPKRTAFAAGVQYQPNADVDINWDIMYSRYNNESTRIQHQYALNGIWGGTIFNNSDPSNPAYVVDENNVLRHMDLSRSSGGGALRSHIKTLRFDNDTTNLISGINIDWSINDKLTSNFDAYVSSIEYDQDLRFPFARKNLDKSQFVYDLTGEIPKVTAPGENDIAGYSYFRTTVREIALEGDNYGLTAKFNFELDDDSGFSSIDFGIHYDKTDIDIKRSETKQLTNPSAGDEIIAASITGELTESGFLGDNNFTPTNWLYMDFDAVVAIDPLVASTNIDSIGIDPSASYDMTESIFALYAQLNIDTEVSGLTLTGNIGLRAVQTDHEANGNVRLNGADPSPITTGDSYWEYLPNLNLNLGVAENVQLRFGFSKTLSRPDYQQLAPINVINVGEDDDSIGSANVGNPNLNPMTALNYDLTLEVYNEVSGAFVMSAFYKDVTDFIVESELSNSTLPGQEGLFDVTTPLNLSGGEAQGFEIGLYQPLEDLIPVLDGFGFSTNYTYVDSSFDNDVGDAGFGFPGSSKDNFNFIGFYETELYSVRLAYIYRSDFFRSLEGTGSQTSSARFTEAAETLDLNVAVRPTKDITVRFNASNITDDGRRDFVGNKTAFLDYFYRGRTYSITAIYRF